MIIAKIIQEGLELKSFPNSIPFQFSKNVEIQFIKDSRYLDYMLVGYYKAPGTSTSEKPKMLEIDSEGVFKLPSECFSQKGKLQVSFSLVNDYEDQHLGIVEYEIRKALGDGSEVLPEDENTWVMQVNSIINDRLVDFYTKEESDNKYLNVYHINNVTNAETLWGELVRIKDENNIQIDETFDIIQGNGCKKFVTVYATKAFVIEFIYRAKVRYMSDSSFEIIYINSTTHAKNYINIKDSEITKIFTIYATNDGIAILKDQVLTKLDKDQGQENANKALETDENGNIVTVDKIVDLGVGTQENPIYVSELDEDKIYRASGYFSFNEAKKDKTFILRENNSTFTCFKGYDTYGTTLTSVTLMHRHGTTEFSFLGSVYENNYISDYNLSKISRIDRYEKFIVEKNIYNENAMYICDKLLRKKTDDVTNIYTEKSLVYPFKIYDDDWNYLPIVKCFVIPFDSMKATRPYIATYDNTWDVNVNNPTYPWNNVEFITTDSEVVLKNQGEDNWGCHMVVDYKGNVVPQMIKPQILEYMNFKDFSNNHNHNEDVKLIIIRRNDSNSMSDLKFPIYCKNIYWEMAYMIGCMIEDSNGIVYEFNGDFRNYDSHLNEPTRVNNYVSAIAEQDLDAMLEEVLI